MACHLVFSVAVAAALLMHRAKGYPWALCGDDTGRGGNFPARRSTYLANINLVAATLPRNASASPELFATIEGAGAGAAPDRVSALALCRGDANASTCLACLTQAFLDLPNACAYNKVATIFYDSCLLTYSNASIIAGDFRAKVPAYGNKDSGSVTTETARFNRVMATLVNATADYAAYNSTRRYASGEADFNQEFPKLYSWAQCTPDLTPARCRRCLAQMTGRYIPLLENSTGGFVRAVRCSFQYSTLPFLDGPMLVQLPGTPAPAPAPAAVVPAVNATPPAATPTPEGANSGRKYSVPGLVLIILLPTVAAMNIVVGLRFCRRKRPVTKAKRTYGNYSNETEDIESLDSMLIDISTLRAATGDFAESNKLGEGGFGAVYKGVLPDGYEIAVKRLSKSSTQGVEELKNELALVAKLKHKNLVSLVGVCLEQQERLLVYEFVPNRSLDLILFDTEKSEQLDWEKRYRIINGIARGLQYLHEDSQLKVVHRDLKASNILLDANMNPKISDFGLARTFGRDQTQAVTKHVIGTYGYMAPEYLMRGNYSIKSDVFSFGVLVLEIVTGRKNNHCYNSQQSEDFLTMMWERWEAGTVLETVDAAMTGCFSESDLVRCIHIGLLCVQGNAGGRPVMSSVVLMLGTDTVELLAPAKPTLFARNGSDRSGVDTGMSIVSLEEQS
ncbi:cysteine-rich receptor-like protein kinase 6 [Oryza brachyantha]|uniref:cysteine-rich receptor-like protein kinase 6 n=1 Tax=Oryza brachyantha TaxID=4533 RepID=UPI001ADAC7E0|nr:cysteine-rich receptor-like protein kinase 6 [Oryza brachyantha]